MKKAIIIIGAVGVFLISGSSIAAEWHPLGSRGQATYAVLLDPKDDRRIYLGVDNAVLFSGDRGENWETSLGIGGGRVRVSSLSFGGSRNEKIFAATARGLFCSQDEGLNWQRIFKGRNRQESSCVASVATQESVYLATRAGLFVSRDNGRSWHKEGPDLKGAQIYALSRDREDPAAIYVCSDKGLYASFDDGKQWRRLVIDRPVIDNEEGDCGISADEDDEEEDSEGMMQLAVDACSKDTLYLTTMKGMYKSTDRGLSWVSLPESGLVERSQRVLLSADNGLLYAATKQGVFGFTQGHWQYISEGLPTGAIYALADDGPGNLYVAGENGLYRLVLREEEVLDKEAAQKDTESISSEPDIRQLQEAAITYCELNPEKIARWRKLAANKALLPEISVGIERDTSDLWHWETGSTTKNGDDCLIKGRGPVAWDVTLSWDLGELIWNDDQTSIDVRSRLMVELRTDVLESLTKMYYERLRLKMELKHLALEEVKKRREHELRIQELAAQLDALTGGYFSAYEPARTGQ